MKISSKTIIISTFISKITIVLQLLLQFYNKLIKKKTAPELPTASKLHGHSSHSAQPKSFHSFTGVIIEVSASIQTQIMLAKNKKREKIKIKRGA